MIWVAEIGSMHLGNKSLAYELIRRAKWAGATIAKFQLGWTREAQEKYTSGYDERRYIDPWAEELSELCDNVGIEFMASIWSMEGLEVARSVNMKRYKIAHQMAVSPEWPLRLREEVDKDNKFVFISRSDFTERNIFYENETSLPVQTTDDYPTTNWRPLSWYHGMGYSSHVPGIADALIAAARGASYIEKHLTLDRALDWPRDASFSLLPEEFKQMVELGEEIERLR